MQAESASRPGLIGHNQQLVKGSIMPLPRQPSTGIPSTMELGNTSSTAFQLRNKTKHLPFPEHSTGQWTKDRVPTDRSITRDVLSQATLGALLLVSRAKDSVSVFLGRRRRCAFDLDSFVVESAWVGKEDKEVDSGLLENHSIFPQSGRPPPSTPVYPPALGYLPLRPLSNCFLAHIFIPVVTLSLMGGSGWKLQWIMPWKVVERRQCRTIRQKKVVEDTEAASKDNVVEEALEERRVLGLWKTT
ncbi:hypothetical protein B0T20DRAFT_395197 [Sordaria brevicollis]|uniref:Uncharacterized protein n=1 Tax=Sordaria brevicollis TaxID=83679 RepID=A0AAE0PB81_SORBR|nr:hypothetical protein B0T20DRAFT_395197 [Sordaria brevicollis]